MKKQKYWVIMCNDVPIAIATEGTKAAGLIAEGQAMNRMNENMGTDRRPQFIHMHVVTVDPDSSIWMEIFPGLKGVL